MLSANKIVKVCLLLSYVESLPTKSLPTLHKIKHFVIDSLSNTKVTEFSRKDAYACLTSLSVVSSDNCNGVLKVPEIVPGTKDLARGFNHCVTLFQKMKDYEIAEQSGLPESPSFVTDNFNLIHEKVLKPCHDKALYDMIKRGE